MENTIEKKRKNIRASILRLARMGAEESKTVIKQRVAAATIMNHVASMLPPGLKLPRGYVIDTIEDKLHLIKLTRPDDCGRMSQHIVSHVIGEDMSTRYDSLVFSHDIATGWLKETAGYLGMLGQYDEQMEKILELHDIVSRREYIDEQQRSDSQN